MASTRSTAPASLIILLAIPGCRQLDSADLAAARSDLEASQLQVKRLQQNVVTLERYVSNLERTVAASLTGATQELLRDPRMRRWIQATPPMDGTVVTQDGENVWIQVVGNPSAAPSTWFRRSLVGIFGTEGYKGEVVVKHTEERDGHTLLSGPFLAAREQCPPALGDRATSDRGVELWGISYPEPLSATVVSVAQGRVMARLVGDSSTIRAEGFRGALFAASDGAGHKSDIWIDRAVRDGDDLFLVGFILDASGAPLPGDQAWLVTDRSAWLGERGCVISAPPLPPFDGTIHEVDGDLASIEVTANPTHAMPERFRGALLLVEDFDGPKADVMITDARRSGEALFLFGRVFTWHVKRPLQPGDRVCTGR